VAASPGSGAHQVTIEVVERGSGDPLSEFRFIVNKDIAHDNASVNNPESYSELVATGDEANNVVNLDDGKYLVTVVGGPFPPTPGSHKLGGQHFEVDGGDEIITVQLVADPLPLANLRVRVFHDNHVVNGEDDIPLEEGIPNFPVILHDPTGHVTVDFFGNPLCTEYDGNSGGETPLGDPIPGTGGQCYTDDDGVDANGDGISDDGPDGDTLPDDGDGVPIGMALIPNLVPLKYEVQAIPPDGSGWIQTTTIEGTQVIDAWVEEGASGFSTEVGFLTAAVWFGFVKECDFGLCSVPNVPQGGGSITGRVRQLSIDTDAPGAGTLGNPVPYPYLALNNISGNDEQVYTRRGNADGTFTIPDVPPGLYQLVVWDKPLDYIIQFYTVQVGLNEAVNIGDIGIPRWFGTIKGYAYLDTGVAKNGTPIPSGPLGPAKGNGVRDCLGSASGPDDVEKCEPGIPAQDLDVRFKDGSIKYATFADDDGYYEFPEYFEWEHFLVWEIGYGRMAQIGTAAYFADEFGNPIDYPYDPENGPVEGLGGLLQAQLTWAGTYQWIDTGKLPHEPGLNGGISGIVYYATTRNEFNPRYAAAEDYEPGIPGVTVNLYEAVVDGDGNPVVAGDGSLQKGALLNSVETDSWYDNLPTDCLYEDPIPGSGDFVNDPECLELPRTWNQIKDGVFDGGYAFETICPAGTFPCDEADEVPMPAGNYIVEVIPPLGYQVIKEEDQNTDQGDDFIPAVPPPPCAGPLHFVDDPRNPADQTNQPLCDSRFVTLEDGFNAGAEFFLMTDNAVPSPGLLRGLLVDDLILEQDPTSPLYVEKRGIANTSVGILDFQNNEIAVVVSDQDGYWEVLLPSSYTALCPTPGGVCPGMYRVVGNYPGSDPANPLPNWNPNYGTLHLVFDIWPAKTTYADVALVPSTNLLPDPTGGFITPPICNIPAGVPDIWAISQPFGSAGTGSFTINGVGFEAVQGSGLVTLDGVSLPALSWSDTAITIEMTQLSLVSEGPHQLLVTNNSGATSPTGITFHVLGGSYNPPQRHVGSGQTYATIQDAIDDAADGDLILVHPGTYFESIIVDENIKLQGYGPKATLIDGRFFNFGGLTPADFLARIQAINGGSGPVGPASVPMGQVVTIVAETTGQHGAGYPTQVDGFSIRGGNVVRGNVPAGAVQQGGGLYAHAYIRNLIVSNNVVQTNSGLQGGGIILGQAFSGDRENDDTRIHHNRVLNNGGFGLAGGIALFNGAEDYEIDYNVVCGNYSAEYGGGISHFGVSPSGHIHDNEVLFNYAFDEGGGVMIAGEQPSNPNQLSPGSGDVLIERNRVQGNASNDDGGGIRLLQPVDGPIEIFNNMIVNNLATDTGGGLSLDDALDVRIINNTIAKNVSTATAEDADRSTCSPPLLGSCPHGAGLVSEPHSQALRDAHSLPIDSFSDPILFNNIFWENEAFFLDGSGGLPSAGIIDLEVVGTSTPQVFSATYSDCTAFSGDCPNDGTNISTDPLFIQEIVTSFTAVPFAGDPAFVSVLLTATPGDPQGDYHLTGPSGSDPGSPAIDEGTASASSVAAPCDDFDGDDRPYDAAHDIGADEVSGGVLGVCTGAPLNLAPTVDAGLDQTITLPASASLDGTVTDDGLPGPYTTLWTAISGPGAPGSVSFGDASAEDTTASFTGSGVYVLELTADDGLLTASDRVTITVNPPSGGVIPAAQFYLSLSGNGSAGTLTGVADEDIIGFTGSDYIMVFDGSDVVSGLDLDAFYIVAPDKILMSFNADTTLPGILGTVDDSDVVQFTGTSFGSTTAGLFSLVFDGSLAGLTAGGEDVDAVELLADGRLVISTGGNVSVPGVSGQNRDLLAYTPPAPDVFNTGTGTWALYFDGSDVGVDAGGENIDAAAVAGGNIYLSTTDIFSVPSLSGADEDIFVCNSPTTGSTTACASFSLYFDGSSFGIGGNDIDAFDLP
jgi:hypothetical protein